MLKKRCSGCDGLLDISEFHASKRSKDGLQNYCKSCNYIKQRERQAKRQSENTRTFGLATNHYQNDNGSTVKEPPYVKILNYKENIDVLADEDYQRLEAERLFNFLQCHCIHGIYQKLKDIMIEQDTKLKKLFEKKKSECEVANGGM